MRYRIPPKPVSDITEYLRGLSKDYPKVTFRVAWWRNPKIAYPLYGGGGFLAGFADAQDRRRLAD